MYLSDYWKYLHFKKMYIFAHVPVTFGNVHLEIQICSGKLCLDAEV